MDTKQDISAKECVNCPGATDHDTAHCPIKPERDAAAEIERLKGIISHVRMHASIQAQEARTQRSIVMEIGAMVGCEEDWLVAGAVRARLNAQPQASAAQSAPDEREGFEAAIRHSYPRNHYLYLTRKADGYENPYISIRWDGFQAGAAWQRAQSAPDDSHGFKNFHRLLCERFSYTHDEKDWRRDQLSLIEHIAAQSAPVVPEGYAIVPVTATAENGAKAALLGEFSIANETICTGCYYGEADDDCEVCGGETHYTEHVTVPWDTIKEIYAEAVLVLAAPQPAGAAGEYGDAYQGAREDLAIWKRRALEAEEKVRHQEQIIDHLTLEAQGETRMGEPVIPAARQEQGE